MARIRCGPVVEIEAEVALGVGLGAGGFFHAIAELDENDFIARGRLAGGAILHRPGESFGGGKRAQSEG